MRQNSVLRVSLLPTLFQSSAQAQKPVGNFLYEFCDFLYTGNLAFSTEYKAFCFWKVSAKGEEINICHHGECVISYRQSSGEGKDFKIWACKMTAILDQAVTLSHGLCVILLQI